MHITFFIPHQKEDILIFKALDSDNLTTTAFLENLNYYIELSSQ